MVAPYINLVYMQGYEGAVTYRSQYSTVGRSKFSTVGHSLINTVRLLK